MNALKLAFRRLFRNGEHTATRIISLIAGLAFGILLLSEVLYYYSFDSFYPDAKRVYAVYENFKMDKSSDKLDSNPRVSGAIAPGLKAEVPGIEAACRLNSIGTSVFYTEDRKSYKGDFSLTDENIFDVLPRPMISGNPEEILSSPMNCMVSDKIAEEMGGDVVGKVIELKEYPGKKLTISGVFKELPENTNYKYDVLVSMVSTSQFTWDGTNNWLGNDRYYACVKLAKGVDPKNLAPAVRKMQEKHQDIEKLEEQQQGLVLKYSFEPIQNIYIENVKDMAVILTTIAFAVLFVSLLNYILLTLSALVKRAKTSAIHKTCGAQSANLQRMILSETVVLFLISLVGAGLTILALKPWAESQIGHSLGSTLNSYVVWPLLLLVVVLLVLTSYLPGRFFSRIPVATAFRSYQQKKDKWKLGLLAVQFIGASFILTVLVIVSMQYNKMLEADHGYRSKGVFLASTSGIEGQKIALLANELRAMPEVEQVGLGCGVPTEGASGNNIFSPDGQRELFNVADFYWIDSNYFSILGVSVKSGQNFSAENAAANDVLISQKGADMLMLDNGWKDGVVGRQLTISEHGSTTVRGVFPDFIIRSLADPDSRPAVFFYKPEEKFAQARIDNPHFGFYFLIKVHEGVQAGMMKKIADIINTALPHGDAVVQSLQLEKEKNYQAQLGFRNGMQAGNVVILLISVLGLLGYTANEATRRRKELAIRRISGAQLRDILHMFILDLEFIVLPAVLIGITAAWFTGGRWMQNFATKIQLGWGIFLGCSLFILILVAAIAAINYTRMANRNPVEALRYE